MGNREFRFHAAAVRRVTTRRRRRHARGFLRGPMRRKQGQRVKAGIVEQVQHNTIVTLIRFRFERLAPDGCLLVQTIVGGVQCGRGCDDRSTVVVVVVLGFFHVVVVVVVGMLRRRRRLFPFLLPLSYPLFILLDGHVNVRCLVTIV